jgi:hypothetical protein
MRQRCRVTPEEERKTRRLESALLAAYVDLDDIVTNTPIMPGPNGKVRWARAKRARDTAKAALDEVSPDKVGTIPMVIE